MGEAPVIGPRFIGMGFIRVIDNIRSGIFSSYGEQFIPVKFKFMQMYG